MEEKELNFPLIPEADHPDINKDWNIEFPEAQFLIKMESYYFHQIVKATVLYSKEKETKETLSSLTAKLELIQFLLSEK